MKKVKTEKLSSSKGYIIAGILTAILAVGVWSILVMAEKKILSSSAQIQCYAFATDIAKGTLIDENSFNKETVKIVELTADAVPENTVTDLKSLFGTYLICDVKGNSLITDNLFGENAVIEGSKTISFGVNGSIRATVGRLRPNDKVDVYLIPPSYQPIGVEVEDLTPIYTNVYLRAVYDSSGKDIPLSDTESLATTFSIIVDDEMANAIVSRLALGYTVWLVKTE